MLGRRSRLRETRHERIRPALCPVRKRRPHSRAAGAADRRHGAPGRGKEGARRFDADIAPRQGRLSPMRRRASSGRPGDGRRRDLPHLFDDEADRFSRRDDAGRGRTPLDHRSCFEIHPRLRQRESRGRKRRQARSCPAQAADHGPGPDAPYVRPHLWFYWWLRGPEARQSGGSEEHEQDCSRMRGGDRRASAHASAG